MTNYDEGVAEVATRLVGFYIDPSSSVNYKCSAIMSMGVESLDIVMVSLV